MGNEDLNIFKRKIFELSDEDKRKRNVYLRKIAVGEIQGPKTNYPSVDKTFLKFYPEQSLTLLSPKMTAYSYMKKCNQHNLNSVALKYFNKTITYDELLTNINKISNSLLNIGVKKGDVITLVTANTIESVYLFYAINKIGAISNLVDPRLKISEISDIINNSQSNYLISLDVNIDVEKITDLYANTGVKKIVTFSPFESLGVFGKILKKIKGKSISGIINWKNFLNCSSDYNYESEYEPDYPALMVRTGGTTGKPKTVILSNDNLNQMAFQHKIGDYNFSKRDTFLNFLPPFIAYGICCATHMPLVLGLENILIPTFDAEDFPKLVSKYKPNVIFGGPILYEKMMTDKTTSNMDLSFLKVPVSGGDTLKSATEQRINDYFSKNGCKYKVGQGYGMTEVASSACYSKEQANVTGSVGIPLINNAISAFKPNTCEELMCGLEGELCIKTDTMMLGYLNDINETEKVIKIHDDGSKWVHTGDLGYIDENGNVFVKGRMKRMIVSNGSKIFPTNVENIINSNPSVLNCAVVAAEHPVYRNVPVVHIVLNDDNVVLETLVEQISAQIKNVLPDFNVPHVFQFDDLLPLTQSSNKIDYKELEKQSFDFQSNIIDNRSTIKLSKKVL